MTILPDAVESKTLDELATEFLPEELINNIDLVQLEVDEDDKGGSKENKSKKERTATVLAIMIVLLLFLAVASGTIAPYVLVNESRVIVAQEHSKSIVPILISLVAGVSAYYFGRERSKSG